MVFDFESMTEQSKMTCFHKCLCPVKHIRHKNLPVKSGYTKKTGESFKPKHFDWILSLLVLIIRLKVFLSSVAYWKPTIFVLDF